MGDTHKDTQQTVLIFFQRQKYLYVNLFQIIPVYTNLSYASVRVFTFTLASAATILWPEMKSPTKSVLYFVCC